MTTRITIFNNTGARVGEIDANVSRSWKLNTYGSGSFTMSLKDAKSIVEYLQLGNFVYMEHDKLPVWGGVIDTPRTWGTDGKITSSIYQAEYTLISEIISARTEIHSGTPGVIYSEITAVKIGTTIPIVAGDIFGGGVSQVKTYHFEELYGAVKDLADESGYEWNLEPASDANGALYFIANWYEKRGVDRLFHLYEDKNIRLSARALTEQGSICNRIIGYGNGDAWSSREVSSQFDSESISKYGHRAKTVNFSGTDSEVVEATKVFLADNKEPRKTFDLVALDVGDTFNNIRIGDTLPIDFYTIGFTGSNIGLSTRIRVLEMSYDDIDNQLKLVCDEVV
jgi:hypothetical protein